MALALIVAAGRGERLGSEGPKALVPLAGRPLMQWSVELMLSVPDIDHVVVALPPGVPPPAGTIAAQGGEVRSQSVANALAAAGSGAPDQLVLVHDAARPLTSPELVRAALTALAGDQRLDAVIAAVPVTDTIKRVSSGELGRVRGDAGRGQGRGQGDAGRGQGDAGRGQGRGRGDAGRGQGEGAGPGQGDVPPPSGAGLVVETLDRSTLWAVQTPQVFRRRALERALDVPADILARATDDAWLVERTGGRVAVVPADATNLKITTPLDLELAELLISRRDADAPRPTDTTAD